MSLHALANHMAEKGRGPDTMLIHMAPSEVHGLQALAQAHGGSLTINPETGLPEAGVLDKLLPAILGFALDAIAPGAGEAVAGLWGGAGGAAAGTAALIGGAQALRTGSIGQGLEAGLGAYGGAGMAEGFMNAGASQLTGDQLAQNALEKGATGTQQELSQLAQRNLTPTEIAATRGATSTGDLFSKGISSAADNPMAFAKANWKPMAAAALPILSDIGTTTSMPGMNQAPGEVHRFNYDPYGQGYTPAGRYQVPVTGANGGLMGMANGGVAHFRAAGYVDDGGLQDQEFTPAPDYAITGGGGAAPPAYTDQQIQNAIAASRQQGFTNDQILQGAQANYGTDVSRFLAPAASTTPDYAITGHGTTVATTGGLDTLAANQAATGNTTAATALNNVGTGATTVGTGATTVGTGATTAGTGATTATTAGTGLDTIAANQAATGNTTATTALNNAGVTTGNTGAVTTAAAPVVDEAAARAQVATIYRNVLGRDPDAAGLAYWSNQIVSGKSPESVYQDMLTAAKTYIPSGVVAADQIKNLNFADATKAYTGYQSADTSNVVDDWVRNIIGREPTAADKEQAWYKNAATNMSNPGAAADTYKQFQGYATQSAQTAAETRAAEAAATIKAAGLTDADVFASTGMHIVDLVKVNPDLAQNLIGASQLKPGETYKPKAIADYVSMDKLVGKDFYGLGQLNQDQQAQLAIAEAKKGIAAGMSDKDIAKAVDIKYLKGFTEADIKKFIDDNHLRLINQPPNSSIIGGSGNDVIGVKTDTGKILPISTLRDGTQVVVNPTQVATTAVTAPTVLNEADRTALPVGVGGNQTATINPNGTVSMTTGTPNAPVGGYTGMQSLRDAYTTGGGNLGYIPVAPKTMAEFNQKYNTLTGGSKQAYDYLMGGDYSPTPYTKTGEVMKPYSESVLGIPGDVSKKRYLFDPTTKAYKVNPDYVPITYDSKGNKLVGISNKDVASYVNSHSIPAADAGTTDYQKWMTDNNVSLEQLAGALGISLADAKKRFGTGTTAATTSTAGVTFDAQGNRVDEFGKIIKGPVTIASGGAIRNGFFRKGKFSYHPDEMYAGGGLAAMANGGYDLGSYSDGGRLLRGPGDGVSDSIPATIGKGRPARLADGEFVVPARIVSEIGNGSTEAGARKLYAMMDRVQAARRSSIGKGNVAKNSRADKYLPV